MTGIILAAGYPVVFAVVVAVDAATGWHLADALDRPRPGQGPRA